MKILRGAASVLALALFILPVHADDAQITTDQTQVLQQIAQADATLPPEVVAILAERRGVADLSDDELKARAAQALAFVKDESLPQDIREQMQSLADAAQAQLDLRAQAALPAAPAEVPKVEQQQAAPAIEAPPAPVVEAPKQEVPAPVVEAPVEAVPAAPVAEAPKQVEEAPAPAAVALPDEVMALMADTRAPTELNAEELNVRAKTARRFAKDKSLPQDIRDQLKAMAQAAHDEFVAREEQKKAAEKAGEPAPPAVVEEAPKAAEPVAPAVVEEAPKAAETVAPAIVLEAPPADAPLAEQAAPAPVVAAPTVAEVKALDGNAGNPEAEQKAKAYLDDATPLESISDVDLRLRLDGVRELMAANELSRDTERAVRVKLKSEREILRGRLEQAQAAQVVQEAVKETRAEPKPIPAAELAAITATPLPPVPVQPPAPPAAAPAVAGATTNNVTVNNTTNNTTNTTTNNNTLIITNVTPVQVVLADRRPPEELQLAELQRRVKVYNDAQYDDFYDAENRDYWRASIARDREILRRRMIAERRARAEQLALNASNDDFDITINVNIDASRPRPPLAVFAAEVDDDELEYVLVAPPRRSIKQRYTLNEIAEQPSLRDTVSRIEIDTIRFGSNEAFIREEQLDSLDGIASIIERIVRKYPNEVFMIEGHTDARGSNALNDKLSKARAEAVKNALVSYYVIPAKNLRTIGLGERFLKIPTADAEPENRRVSIARITQLLSQTQ